MIEQKKSILESALNQSRQIFITSDYLPDREYNIKQPTLKQILEISKILIEIEIKDLKDFVIDNKNTLEFVKDNTDKIIDIIAISLNEKDKDFISNNLNLSETHDILINILDLINIKDFQKSIIATTAMSLMNQAELIAAL